MYKAKSLRASVPSTRLSIKPLAAAIVMFAVASQVHATVSGGTVAAGAAAISTNGTTTTIQQSTDRAVINWKNFNVAANETVNINQPASTSAILNRVDGTLGGTRIDGQLNANGRVFVVNAKGIRVGNSGKINANGVVLSTLDVSDANFMEQPNGFSGNTLKFRRAASLPQARIVNDGTITAAEAGISLFGGEVINSATGSLTAAGSERLHGGVNVNSVNLVAADSIDALQGGYMYDEAGTAGLSAKVTPDLPNNGNNLVANDGAISLNAGQVLLQAANNQNTAAAAVRNTGSIDVTGYTGSNAAYNSLTAVELRTGYTDAIYSSGPGYAEYYRGGGGSMFVGGTINAPGRIGLYTDKGPLTVAGSVTGSGMYGTVDIGELSGSHTINIGVGGNVFGDRRVNIGYQYADAHDGAITVDGKVVSHGYAFVFGNDVKVRPDSIAAPYYYLNVDPYYY